MRSGLDAATLALYESGKFDAHWRLKVANGSGTLIDLQGRYSGGGLKLPDSKAPIGSLSVEFVRETTDGDVSSSLAPTVEGSSYNKLDDGTTYSPLLQIGRAVLLEVALTNVGDSRPIDASTLWYEIFEGVVSKVNWPKHDDRKASIEVNGLAAKLQHQKSETAYTYAQGTSIETVARQILDNNGFPGVPLYFPAATGKTLQNTYEPGLQKTVWSQLWDLARSMGWICYYRYRGQNPPELTFFEPARTKTVPDMTVDADDFRALSIDETEIRNVGYLLYFNADGGQELIGPKEDASSITKYGGFRRPFWIKLEENSPVRDAAAADAMLTAALSDVADPDVVASAQTFPLVFGEVGVDLYTFPSRKRFFDTDQDYAPFSISVNFAPNKEDRSVVGVRGKPTAGALTWKYLGGGKEPNIIFQYATDATGTGATPVFDPTIHTHARQSRDGGRTWGPWYRLTTINANSLYSVAHIWNELNFGEFSAFGLELECTTLADVVSLHIELINDDTETVTHDYNINVPVEADEGFKHQLKAASANEVDPVGAANFTKDSGPYRLEVTPYDDIDGEVGPGTAGQLKKHWVGRARIDQVPVPDAVGAFMVAPDLEGYHNAPWRISETEPGSRAFFTHPGGAGQTASFDTVKADDVKEGTLNMNQTAGSRMILPVGVDKWAT